MGTKRWYLFFSYMEVFFSLQGKGRHLCWPIYPHQWPNVKVISVAIVENLSSFKRTSFVIWESILERNLTVVRSVGKLSHWSILSNHILWYIWTGISLSYRPLSVWNQGRNRKSQPVNLWLSWEKKTMLTIMCITDCFIWLFLRFYLKLSQLLYPPAFMTRDI